MASRDVGAERSLPACQLPLTRISFRLCIVGAGPRFKSAVAIPGDRGLSNNRGLTISMGIKKRVASVGAALVLSSAGIITATAMAPEAQAGTCWYSQNTRATYNDVCRIGSRHYITTFQSGYYLTRFASTAYSYGVSQFSVCYVGEVGWGTYRLDTGSYYPV